MRPLSGSANADGDDHENGDGDGNATATAHEIPGGVPSTASLPPSPGELDALVGPLGASYQEIERPQKLARTSAALERIRASGKGRARILVLGDSHIAADYVTRTVRRRLQETYGAAGRGFVVVDQRAPFGGRRVERRGFVRTRIVDRRSSGKAFGFAGMMLTSVRGGAKVVYALEPEETAVDLYYQGHRRGPQLRVVARGRPVVRFSTRAEKSRARRRHVSLPPSASPEDAASEEHLELIATGAGARLHGLSFETGRPGVFLDAVGPVGADAAVYLSLDRRSMTDHLRSLDPKLVILWLGGNDALAIRQGRRSIPQATRHFEALIRMLRRALPNAECLVWGPMDAGERVESDEGPIVSKSLIAEMRDLTRGVAATRGCAFWDPLEAMGGLDSFGRWHERGLMNDDLVHPRALGGELLGHLAVAALEGAFRLNR